MNITQFNSKEELDQHAAELFAALLAHNPQATLGLATGSTPTGIYEKMIKMHQAGRLSFNEAATFNLDEYVGLPPGHDQSYAYYMNKYLFNHVDVRREHIHLLDGMADDLAAECSRYDQLLAAKPIDIQLLGLGHNGHIGFNEPDHSLQGG
ncbi:glucosamine-6-phosphate deaminase, partial [Paenibacillus sepulcri]|nr:glucosamine-6-phosphate deaminase [Paenibacillus sepulcri]